MVKALLLALVAGGVMWASLAHATADAKANRIYPLDG